MAYTTIDDPEAYFQTVLYTGDTSAQSITLPGDTDLQPNMVWIKVRDASAYVVVQDSVRGVTGTDSYNIITDAASTDVSDSITALNSDGFTVGTDSNDRSNYDGQTHVAWCWKESATAGFDIVSYTGNGSARTISHSLSAVPKMYIIKNLEEGDSWQVYHGSNTSAPETDFLQLNENGATTDSDARFNDTAPTSSVFSVGDHVTVNKNTIPYIAYLFADKQGYSKTFSYEGNGETSGTFVYLGFRPAWLMVKPIDAADNWVNFDNKRLGFNSSVSPYSLHANKNFAETTDTGQLDFLSNGFKIRNSGNTVNRTSTFIGIAFAEAPFVNSKGVPGNAR